MITLTKRLRAEAEAKQSESSSSTSSTGNSNSTNFTACSSRISIRDQLLVQEVQEMEQNLPVGCRVRFEDPNALHDFMLIIIPEDGLWVGGRFKFHITVNEEYNFVPPKVKCLTRLWHPNINEEGDVCLSILRENSIDGMGWAPTRRLKDVIWGLNSLFTDLLNFEDPLNRLAAQQFIANEKAFKHKVREWVHRYARR